MKLWSFSFLNVGFWFCIDKNKEEIYGKYWIGIHIGRYSLTYSSKYGLKFRDYFGTGQGG